MYQEKLQGVNIILKKKTTIIAILSGFLLIVGLFIVTNHFVKIEGANHNKIVNNFNEQVNISLKNEGYSTFGLIMSNDKKAKKIQVKIELLPSEHKGTQTENNIKNLIKRLAKKSHIDPFLERIEITTIREK
jgi:uncharacterized membrane protein